MFPPLPRCLKREQEASCVNRASTMHPNDRCGKRNKQMNVIQFMHPGDEIRANGSICGWNVSGRHGRKLLLHSGEYVDAGNQSRHNDNLCFWNEYEASSSVHPILHHSGWEFARCYHQIIKPIQPSPYRQRNCRENALDECCDNTDPCVFGETFKYSNCQQVPNGDLWNLPQGSLILFGSHHAGMFYLDTVFVTNAPGVKYSVPIANHRLPFVASQEYRIVTLNNLMPRRNGRNSRNPIIAQFMFYRGKLPLINDDGYAAENDIFSFTPAKILNNPDYNKRCKIDLAALNTKFQHVPGWRDFSPGLTQTHKTIVFNSTQVNVAAIWREVRDAVRQDFFELGYHFAW